jgi:steroid 5-alpha reductase family enzyme
VTDQVWVVSLPVIVLNSPAVSDPTLGGSNPAFGTARDVAGIVLWALGLAIETLSDTQKARRHILFLVQQW